MQYHADCAILKAFLVELESVRILICPAVLLNHSHSELSKDIPSVELKVPVQVRQCGLAIRLLIQGSKQVQRQEPDARLIQLIAKAHDWLGRLTSGKAKSVMEIAAAEGVSNSYVTRVIYRAFLAPDIVQAILDGTQPPSLTLDKLKKNLPLPIRWEDQKALFGFKA